MGPLATSESLITNEKGVGCITEWWSRSLSYVLHQIVTGYINEGWGMSKWAISLTDELYQRVEGCISEWRDTSVRNDLYPWVIVYITEEWAISLTDGIYPWGMSYMYIIDWWVISGRNECYIRILGYIIELGAIPANNGLDWCFPCFWHRFPLRTFKAESELPLTFNGTFGGPQHKFQTGTWTP